MAVEVAERVEMTMVWVCGLWLGCNGLQWGGMAVEGGGWCCCGCKWLKSDCFQGVGEIRATYECSRVIVVATIT